MGTNRSGKNAAARRKRRLRNEHGKAKAAQKRAAAGR
jgi:hypothetical protein